MNASLCAAQPLTPRKPATRSVGPTLSLLHYRAPRRALEPEESLKAFEQRGARPTFWEDAKPYPERRMIERWLEQQI